MLKPKALSMAWILPREPPRIQLHGAQIRRLIVTTICDHQLLIRLAARVDIACASLTVVAIGFSLRHVCRPFAARMVYSACMPLGNAMYMASMSGLWAFLVVLVIVDRSVWNAILGCDALRFVTVTADETRDPCFV